MPHLTGKKKKSMFKSLENKILLLQSDIIIVCGDFNSVRNERERTNYSYRLLDSSALNKFIDHSNLMDLKISNASYTWIGPGNKISRLDRILINQKGSEIVDWIIKALPRKNSDHRGLLLSLDRDNWGPKPFKFFNAWLHDKTLLDKVYSIISSTNSQGSCSLQHLLKNIKEGAKIWNKESNDNIFIAIDKVEQNLEVLEDRCNNPEIVLAARDFLENLQLTKDKMLFQMAKVHWLKDGDRNSKFFHQAIQKRKAMNRIQKISWKGSQCVKPDSIKNAFLSHFKDFFRKRNDGNIFIISDLIQDSLSSEDRLNLDRKFEIEEIELAANQCGRNKAPGPDGLTIELVIEFWTQLKDQVLNMFNNFHENGFIPLGMNSSFIALIPKKINSSLVTDFRPISLINTSLKILTKTLNNRFGVVMGKLRPDF